MPYRFTAEKNGDLLVFDVSGSVDTTDELIEFAKIVLSSTKRERCKRVLLDERELSISFDQFETYLFAEEVSPQVPSMGLRFAAIHSEANCNTYHWVETILQNRSINYKIFCSKEQGLDWLLA